MQNISQLIESVAREAFNLTDIPLEYPILLTEATNPKFGDYQINGVMKVAKILKINPITLANNIIKHLDTSLFKDISVAGPGFINLSLTNEFLATYLAKLTPENHFGAKIAPELVQNIIVDMSSPNLAKEMHVGHLRSTVIGDALANLYTYLGHSVLRQNHVGDWGTQFGMLITYFQQQGLDNKAGVESKSLADLEVFYREAKQAFDSDQEFAHQARVNVVKLQSGDSQILTTWRKFCQISLAHADDVYKALKINLNAWDIRGESFYNPYLAETIKDIEQAGLLTESKGAKCVFFADKQFNNDSPLIVQKQDGGYLYATTDLAALKYRVTTLHAQRIVYVIDSRQALHLGQVFYTAKQIGYAKPDTLLEHCAFGTVMGEDNKPFKTREGSSIKLMDLINTAINKALEMLKERHHDWDELELMSLAQTIAISSIKYADLAKNRSSDYVFSYKQMLSFEGNTAPYILYAYTRIQSILNKGNVTSNDFSLASFYLTKPSERELALHLTKWALTLHRSALDNYPHLICSYLYDLSGYFMRFYEECPILNAEDEAHKFSRLRLSKLTAEILSSGLGILGIIPVNRM